jgi:hypothetical protein
VVHRDIKPANIIITPELKAMLVDFGIAKADPQMRTLSGARAWTPGYAPPEQYGQGRTDARSDVYSLAATAYALLTGESPPDAMDVAAGNLRPARPVAELNPVVPAYVSRAIAKAMLFNREQRTATVDEFRQALRKKTKPASERVIVPESQKTILEPKQETPPAPKQDSAPPPTQEKTKPPAPVVPVDTPPLEELLQAAAPAILVEKALEEGKASPPETPPSAEKTRIEEHPLPPEPSQPAAPVLGVEEMPVVEEAPVYVPPFIQEQQPVESSPVEMKPVPPAVRQPAWQKLGWKGIGAILAVIVILAIVIGVLLNPGDPQGSEDPDGAAAAATVTLREAVNLPATHNASVATATATQTPPVVLEATATVANRLLDARSTATVQTLSRFKEARTQTALAKLAGGAEPTMAPTTTPRPVIKTATPTPTKKPKKKDDGQITLEPGLTLVP